MGPEQPLPKQEEPKKVVISISVDKKNLEILKEHIKKEHDSLNISRSFNFWLGRFVDWLEQEGEKNKK